LKYNLLGGLLNLKNYVLIKVNDEAAFPGIECLFATDEFQEKSPSFISKSIVCPPKLNSGSWKFGFVTYDFKNRGDNLTSKNLGRFSFPDMFFFNPTLILALKNEKWEVLLNSSNTPYGTHSEPASHRSQTEYVSSEKLNMKPRLSKTEYIQRVQEIKTRIKLGEIYELNFCQEFYAENVKIDPLAVAERLRSLSPAPFSAFCRFGDKYLISSSPERFLKKTGQRLISQPIKGTKKRSKDQQEDVRLKEDLLLDEKERAENVMIVDLVRNDLSRIAKKGSVKVDELFGIYSFEQVHQMISTVSAELREEVSFVDILGATFPMGSMTGAPKIRAMQLIDQFENSRRGLYSGALGYITPEGDFDFSVVIRTILYDSANKYVSFSVGSAITDKSDPEKEYEECLLKATALLQALNAEIVNE
jgi:para-aminobenzoate synthetase component 1